MLIQDDLDGALAELRVQALGRMKSRGLAKRKASTPTQDETTGVDVFPWTTLHTDLPVRFVGASRDASAWKTNTRAGGVQDDAAERQVHVPWDTAGFHDGDVIELTAGEHAGVFIQITEATGKDQATALRMPVIQIEKPEGWDL